MTLNQSIAARKRVNNKKAEVKAIVGVARSLKTQTGTHIYPSQVKVIIDEFQNQMKTQLAEQMPAGECVRVLRDLATQREHLPTSLNAIHETLAIMGLHDKANKEDRPEPAPLFALPAGTKLKLEIEQPTIIDVPKE